MTFSFVRRYSSSLSESDGKPGRRHSHNIVSMAESDTPPQLPSPTRPLLLPSSGKAPLTNVGESARSIWLPSSKNTPVFETNET